MWIKTLKLKNFRNHKERVFSFNEGINFLYGNNAQGKTNVVESIYFFASSKSFQTSRENEVVKEGETIASVKMTLEKSFGETELDLNLDNTSKKTFYVNGEKITKLSKIFGNFCAVLFSPDQMKIVKNAPEDRRRFIDTAISELSGVYFELINRYEKILYQRNRALKNRCGEDELEVWDQQLALYASKIVFQRQKFIEKFSPLASKNMEFLSKGRENIEVSYTAEFSGTGQEIKEKIITALEKNRQKDYELGFTSIGPHRDDIVFKLNGKDAKAYASQGQQRSLLLALKLAEYEVIENETGEKPVLLLDDVFSELDLTRSRLLLERIKSGQTIITGTKTKKAPFPYKKIKI